VLHVIKEDARLHKFMTPSVNSDEILSTYVKDLISAASPIIIIYFCSKPRLQFLFSTATLTQICKRNIENFPFEIQGTFWISL